MLNMEKYLSNKDKKDMIEMHLNKMYRDLYERSLEVKVAKAFDDENAIKSNENQIKDIEKFILVHEEELKQLEEEINGRQ